MDAKYIPQLPKRKTNIHWDTLPPNLLSTALEGRKHSRLVGLQGMTQKFHASVGLATKPRTVFYSRYHIQELTGLKSK